MTTSTQTQIEALIKALEPFAKIEIPPEASDGMWVAETLYCNNQITAFQVRQARAACNAKISFDAALTGAGELVESTLSTTIENVKTETIERCAQMAEEYGGGGHVIVRAIAAAIRALKDKP